MTSTALPPTLCWTPLQLPGFPKVFKNEYTHVSRHTCFLTAHSKEHEVFCGSSYTQNNLENLLWVKQKQNRGRTVGILAVVTLALRNPALTLGNPCTDPQESLHWPSGSLHWPSGTLHWSLGSPALVLMESLAASLPQRHSWGFPFLPDLWPLPRLLYSKDPSALGHLTKTTCLRTLHS